MTGPRSDRDSSPSPAVAGQYRVRSTVAQAAVIDGTEGAARGATGVTIGRDEMNASAVIGVAARRLIRLRRRILAAAHSRVDGSAADTGAGLGAVGLDRDQHRVERDQLVLLEGAHDRRR